MSFAACRPCVLGLAAALLLAARGASGAEELPPSAPKTDYRGQFRVGFNGLAEDGSLSETTDTVDVWVSGRKLREASRTAHPPKVTIIDLEKSQVVVFTPSDPEKLAVRFERNEETPVLYVEGSVRFEDWSVPSRKGTDAVAGHSCTVLHYGAPDQDGASVCVTKEGIVVRAKVKSAEFERTWEALELTVGAQDAKQFAPPAGFKVRDGEGGE